MRIVVACQRCGHEREITRDELLKGAYKRKPCPVCQSKSSIDKEQPE